LNKVTRLAAAPAMTALRHALTARVPQLLDEAVTIQQIPAPTFHEERRAAYVYERFRNLPTLDPDSVLIDDLYNVYGRLPGADPAAPALLVSAHTDTVFEQHTPLTAHRYKDTIHGPGIGDNSLGVAAVLALADLFSQFERLPADIWFVANSREEGMGDLGGIRGVYERLKGRIGYAIVIEGMALGHIYIGGIAVRRLKISCSGPGGHSWLHFSRGSAIHALMRLGANIAALRPPESPRTTYNIGVVSGGQSVNTIAPYAEMLLDMRSETREGLAALERTIMSLVESARTADLSFKVEVVGDRPAGHIPKTHPLPSLAADIMRHIGQVATFESGSTDANLLLAAGLPAVTVGITTGANAHRTDEYIDIPPVWDGMYQLALLVAGAAEGVG